MEIVQNTIIGIFIGYIIVAVIGSISRMTTPTPNDRWKKELAKMSPEDRKKAEDKMIQNMEIDHIHHEKHIREQRTYYP